MSKRAQQIIEILENRFGWDCSTLETTKHCPVCSRGYSRYDTFCSTDATRLVFNGTLDGVAQVEVALREVIDLDKCSTQQTIKDDYYTYEPEELVNMVDFMSEKRYPCKVITCYTSDKHNHAASPHKRYTILFPNGKLDDVCEAELEKE